ncbi:MAG: hypothetical protein WKG01_14045 [Kofleriaceae bacterium]
MTSSDEVRPEDNKDHVINDSGSACAVDEVSLVDKLPEDGNVTSSCVARQDLEADRADLFYCFAGRWSWWFENYRGPTEYLCIRPPGGPLYCGTFHYTGWVQGKYTYVAYPGTMCTN